MDRIDRHANNAQSLDGILLLAGENPETRPRTTHTGSIYNRVRTLRKLPFIIVATGYEGGASNHPPEYIEAELMKEHLTKRQRVRSEEVLTETQSLDTYTNMVFSKPLLEEHGLRRIGLVTGTFHTPRSLALAKYVLGRNYHITPLPATEPVKLQAYINEVIAGTTLLADLAIRRIRPGDQTAHETFTRQKHPFYNPTANTLFGTALRIAGKTNGAGKI